jgi:hypothetical protein
MEFLEKLNKNAFSQLDIEHFTPDIQGWMDPSFTNTFRNIVKGKDIHKELIIVEVGSWKGLSCITMASILKELGFTNFKIIAVDTWLGAPEFWTWGLNDVTRGESLNFVNGWPTVFHTFTKNIKYSKHDDVVSPLPLSSLQAADVLKYYNISADMIYIDASHEYEAVKQDILHYWGILKTGGTMLGDDYTDHWWGVKKAVNESGYAVNVNGAVWSINK